MVMKCTTKILSKTFYVVCVFVMEEMKSAFFAFLCNIVNSQLNRIFIVG